MPEEPLFRWHELPGTTRPITRLQESVRDVIASGAELRTWEREAQVLLQALEQQYVPVDVQGQLEHPHEDHAELELVALAKAGDEAGFRELAACVMPLHDIDVYWAGTRRRLGLAPAEPPPAPPTELWPRLFFDEVDNTLRALGLVPVEPDPPPTSGRVQYGGGPRR